MTGKWGQRTTDIETGGYLYESTGVKPGFVVSLSVVIQCLCHNTELDQQNSGWAQ